MNAPTFDMNRCPSAWGSADWMHELCVEKSRCCDPIDARIDQINNEATVLRNESISIDNQLKTNCGLFTRMHLTYKMRCIDNRRAWLNTVRIQLYEARLRRMPVW